jgi:hypothetical protein
MMQHCFYNLRYISDRTFIASARICEIWNVNAFGAELTKGWHILLHISTIYHAVHSIMELKKTSLFCWNMKLHATFYTSRSKFNCFPYSTYPYRSGTISIWKLVRTCNHYSHINIVHKTYRHLSHSYVKPLPIAMNHRCFHICYWYGETCLQTKGMLEEMLNLFHNVGAWRQVSPDRKVPLYARISVCKYWYMKLPKTFKGTDSSGETLLQPTGNSRLQKCVISIQSYVYNEMIKLLPMKVPVKKYSYVDWIRQAKNTELTFGSGSSIAAISLSCISLCRLSVRNKSRCKRKTHWVNECTMVQADSCHGAGGEDDFNGCLSRLDTYEGRELLIFLGF